MASRTPSPEHWHPAVSGTSTNHLVPVCVVYVYAPQARVSGVHPRALGRLVALTRICPSARLQTGIDSFIGWLLEAFTMPMERNVRLRQYLREWQLQLRGDCRNVRLKWHEAFAIYGLDLELS